MSPISLSSYPLSSVILPSPAQFPTLPSPLPQARRWREEPSSPSPPPPSSFVHAPCSLRNRTISVNIAPSVSATRLRTLSGNISARAASFPSTFNVGAAAGASPRGTDHTVLHPRHLEGEGVDRQCIQSGRPSSECLYSPVADPFLSLPLTAPSSSTGANPNPNHRG